MKNLKPILLIMMLFIISSTTSFSQNLHVVELSNFMFSPSTITITVGDTIQWTNVSGNHNVVADDGSFTSGPPAFAPWDFFHIFNTEGTFPYYCEPHGGPGGSGMSGVIIVETPVSVSGQEIVLDDFKLNQNYPNPFNPITTIKYQIPETHFVSLKVYDILGNEAATLINSEKSAGNYEITWDAENIPSGIYFYTLNAGSFVDTKKMILLK